MPWSTDLGVATPPAWLVELWEQVRMIEAEEHEDWPRGVIVGSAIIERCEEVAGGKLLVAGEEQKHLLATSNQQLTTPSPRMYAWHLKDVQRATKLRRPSGRPQPVWFRPFGQ
jgi:hypothetical protein